MQEACSPPVVHLEIGYIISERVWDWHQLWPNTSVPPIILFLNFRHVLTVHRPVQTSIPCLTTRIRVHNVQRDKYYYTLKSKLEYMALQIQVCCQECLFS